MKKLMLSSLFAVSLTLSSIVSAEEYNINLQEANIRAFVSEIAYLTGQTMVLDPRINGNVTVVSTKGLSKPELYELFLSVMQVNGISAIRDGSTTRLIPATLATKSGVKFDPLSRTIGDMPSTRVIYLKNTRAEEILLAVRPLMLESAHAAAVPSINALVLSDRANSLNELASLIANLDNDLNDGLYPISLLHVDSDRMMDLISSLIGSSAAVGSSESFKIISDMSSDRLLVKGSPEMIIKVETMVKQLDVMPTKRLSGLRVFPLKYGSAEEMASMLRDLLVSQSVPAPVAAAAPVLQPLLLDADNSSSFAPAPVPVQSYVEKASRPFSIIADVSQNSILVSANPQLMNEVEEAINQLDRRRAQVLIQAAIVEISGDDAEQLGVQWSLGNANNGYGVVKFAGLAGALTGGSSAAAAAISGGLLGIGKNKVDNNGNDNFYGAVLQALNTTTSANLLSMPSILTLDNEQASILVGQNVPLVTGSFTTNGDSSDNPFQTVERKDIGISLNVIPHIGANGTVRLQISQEVSNVVPASVGNSSGITTNKSLINTTILADDMQTIALGGLMRDDSSNLQQKVPVLGDMPLFGRLFRSDSTSKKKSNLIVFLQPTILRDGGAIASITEKKMDEIKTMQLIIDKNGTIKKVPLEGFSSTSIGFTL